MTLLRRLFLVLAGCALLVASALALNPTVTLTGNVTDRTLGFPGVTVTVKSPNLQRVRNGVSTINPDGIFTFLPPSRYYVRFELPGFQTPETFVRALAAQTAKLDVTKPQERVAEAVTVVGRQETTPTPGQAATTNESRFIEKPPLPRDLNNAVRLAPGVNTNRPRGGITIPGH